MTEELRKGRTSDAEGELLEVEPLLLTIRQAARALAIGRTTLYELIADRQIEVLHIGRSTRIPLDAVRAFVEDQRDRR